MSSIYVNEPATTGKVCMKTTVGDIDIELFAKETPKACRNFIQLAMEGYFDNTIFHRVVKDFIVQGGDSTGTGLGGESIYDNEPFKDEFHSRLKFNRRGLLGMANAGKDDNKSQFFFTMAATPELNNKHTLFGKVTGTTIFNMLKLQEGVVDANERPEEPKRIISIEILKNPFDDIVPRELKSKRPVEEVKTKSKSRATKDFKLLSFGEEAEEDESDLNSVIAEKFQNKGKSLPDLIEDKSKNTEFKKTRKITVNADEEGDSSGDKPDSVAGRSDRFKKPADKFRGGGDEQSSESDDEYAEEKKKMEKARMEIENLKREEFKKRAIEKIDKQVQSKEEANPVLSEFKKSKEKYNKCNYSKSANREQQALALLEKFKKKMKTDEPAGEEGNWLKHKLQVEEEETPVLAKDANLKNDSDWYEIHDPRNPINKQRREMDAGIRKKAKKT